MGGAVVLPTGKLHLDYLNEMLMDILEMFLCIAKITHLKKPLERIIYYHHRHSFLLHIIHIHIFTPHLNSRPYSIYDKVRNIKIYFLNNIMNII